MSAVVTTLIGIALLGISLFFAFGAGVEMERHGPNRPNNAAVWSFVACMAFAVASIGLLLVRS